MDELLSKAKSSHGRHVTLRTVLRTCLFFGFYSGIRCNPTLRFLARLYCLCLAVVHTYVFMSFLIESDLSLILPIIQIFKYIVTVLISLHAGDNLINFCMTMAKVDTQMGFDNLLLITPSIQVIYFILIFTNVICPILFMFHNPDFTIHWVYHATSVINAGLDFNSLASSLALDLVRYRLYVLRHVFKMYTKRHNIGTSVNNVIINITDCMKLYSSLIDSIKILYPWGKLQIFINFASSFAVFLICALLNIMDMKNNDVQVTSFIAYVVRVLIYFLITCLPCVFSELVTREVEEFRSAIGNELLDCQDEEISGALVVAGDYMELRPFKVTLCRVFALDASLALSFISLCTTSLVVIIQYTGVI